MIRVEKLKAKHLSELLEQRAKAYIGPKLTPAQTKALEDGAHSYSVFIGDKVMLCGGVTEYWKGRGEAWAVFHPKCRNHFVELHLAAKRFLEVCPVDRIEAAVAVDFKAGHRWVKTLGFEYEATCKKFLPDGSTAHLYARVRV